MKAKKAQELIEALFADDDDEDEKKPEEKSGEDIPLDELVASYVTKHEFKLGQRVTWKKGLKSHNLPKYGQEAYIVELINPPFFDEEAKQGPYHKMRYDVRVAIKHKAGGFITYPLCSDYLEPVERVTN